MADTITRVFTAASAGVPGMTYEGPDLETAAGGFPPEGYCVEPGIVEREDSFTFNGETTEYTEVSFRIPSEVMRQRLPLVEALCRKRYEGRSHVEQAVKSYYDFVLVYEELEAEGREPSIYVSY